MVVYKTTNLLNGKFYIGKDARNRKSYYGSGKVLKQAIKKNGKENFKKEILEYCTDLDQLAEREVYWINETNAIQEGYNIAEGGTGGNTGYIPDNTGSTPWNKGLKGGMPVPWNRGLSNEMTKKMKNKTSYKPGKDHVYYGTKQSKETIQKRVETARSNGSYKGVGVFAPKQVKNIEDGLVFESIKKAAEYYGKTWDQVSHSCRKETKKGKFRFA